MVKSWIGGDVTQRDIFVSLKRDSLPDYPKKKERDSLPYSVHTNRRNTLNPIRF
jgi:hypothetical protein